MKKTALFILLLLVTVHATGCGNGSSGGSGGLGTTTYVQIERLGMPGINEGLVTTNAYLNAFNSIGPDQDLSDAAAPVLTEARGTLELFAITVGGGTQTDVDNLVAAFIPDVMRVDTTIASSFASAANSSGRPIAGRKLTDDVVDGILATLTLGAITTDNVSYAGNNAVAQGHTALTASFPFIPAPY